MFVGKEHDISSGVNGLIRLLQVVNAPLPKGKELVIGQDHIFLATGIQLLQGIDLIIKTPIQRNRGPPLSERGVENQHPAFFHYIPQSIPHPGRGHNG